MRSKETLLAQNCYSASITREQFLFYETRTTAKLLIDGLREEEVINRIVEENLFQYPTEKMVRRMALTCVRRLQAIGDTTLVEAIATQPSEVAKQICLYAMIKQYRLVWDFMVTVIGEKYRLRENSFSKVDLNAFFIRLQEQDDKVASWSENTIAKLKQVLKKILIETEYLDNTTTDILNPVWLFPVLENVIRNKNEDILLPAFNCFS